MADVERVWLFTVDPATGNVLSLFDEPMYTTEAMLKDPKYVTRPLIAGRPNGKELAWYTYVRADPTEDKGYRWRFKKTSWRGMPIPEDIMSLKFNAIERITESPSLQPYAGLLLYDWPELAQHLTWLISAPLESIERWCGAIETVLLKHFGNPHGMMVEFTDEGLVITTLTLVPATVDKAGRIRIVNTDLPDTTLHDLLD